jgi:hypothetical protein
MPDFSGDPHAWRITKAGKQAPKKRKPKKPLKPEQQRHRRGGTLDVMGAYSRWYA